MARSQNVSPVVSSYTTARDASKVFGQMLAAAGFVRSSDTGQINWDTVAPLGGAGDLGYEVFYLNDAVHAAAPVYIKLVYANTTSSASVTPSVGYATDGSGTLTSWAGMPTWASIAIGNGTNNLVRAASDGSGLWFSCAENAWLLDRTRDATGAPTASGIIFTSMAAGNSYNYMYAVSFEQSNLVSAAISRLPGYFWSHINAVNPTHISAAGKRSVGVPVTHWPSPACFKMYGGAGGVCSIHDMIRVENWVGGVDIDMVAANTVTSLSAATGLATSAPNTSTTSLYLYWGE